jgi:hypothetical protein
LSDLLKQRLLIFISPSWAAKSAYSSILFRGANNSRPFKGKCLTKKPIKMKAKIQEEKDAAIQACGYDVKHVAYGKMYDVWNIKLL